MTKKRKIMIIVLSLVLLAGIITSGTVLGKYFTNVKGEQSVSSSNFYFESDYLKPSSASASYTVVGSSLAVSLKNYVDSNHVTTPNIAYTVSVTNGTASPSSGTITGGSANTSSFIITPTNTASPVVVTATSTSPFSKSLTATFNFTPDMERTAATYLIEDNAGSDYATLKILAGNTIISAGTLTLSWNTSDVYLDPTNPYVSGNAGLSTGTLVIQEAIAPHSTAVIHIFKEDITDNFSHSESSITSNTISISASS